MRYTLAALALSGLASAVPQVTSAIAPSTSAPAGCMSSYQGNFEIQVMNVTSSSKRSIQKRQDTALVLTLQDGILHDAEGRTGYIAANYQFQFDKPPQTGAIYTAGFSVCGNGSLALGGSAVFYQCLSGNFYNLYSKNWAAQCSPVYIEAIGGASASQGVASQTSDGQVTAKPTSGQVSQYTDGQPQETPVSSMVCEYTDGQPQVTGCAPVTQISDGQIQATTGAGAPVTQISDGQVQATTAAGAPCTEYKDGQPQCSTMATVTAAPCTEYKDGQPQCSTAAASGSGMPYPYANSSSYAAPTASAVAATGGAATFGISSAVSALVMFVAALAML